jgi:heme-degrading monooxygenase HmoA
MVFQLAQVNVARLLAPIDSEQLLDFVSALDDVNASADVAPGFVWRLQTEAGNATAIVAFEWDIHDSAGVIVNLSVWESLEQLTQWIHGPLHRAVLLQRRRWFERVSDATTALWWVSEGHRPSTLEAESRLLHLREHGPTPTAFSFKETFVSPS